MVSTILANLEGCQERVLAGRLPFNCRLQITDELQNRPTGPRRASGKSRQGTISQLPACILVDDQHIDIYEDRCLR